MAIGAILQRTWQIVWNHKFMIGLGLLVGFGTNALSGIPAFFALPAMQNSMLNANPMFSDLSAQQQAQMQSMMGMQTAFAACAFLVIGIPLWVLSRICVGGVIDATKTLGQDQPMNFSASFSAGRARMWPMMGIGALASIPVMFLVILQLIYSTGAMPNMYASATDWYREGLPAMMRTMLPFYGISAAISVIGGLIILPLLIWAVMAERVCVLEGKGVFDSFQRAGNVLLDHVREAVLLALALIGIGLAFSLVLTVVYLLFFGAMMLLPCIGFLMCLLIPVLWAAAGLGYSLYHTVWTLAWQQWVPTPAPAAPPAAPTPAA